jgi:acyl-coenzyme A thioesterase PaaI-like protein
MMTATNENLTPLAHAAQNRCFGCGEANPVGLHLKFFLAEDGTVVCNAVVPDLYEGPPGYAHGGIIATLLDETMSKAVRSHGVVAMTARLELDYKRPVPSSAADEPHTVRLEGRVVRSEGRKHWVEARIVSAEGVELTTGKGLFIEVKPRLAPAI